jgi:hypothetical protein
VWPCTVCVMAARYLIWSPIFSARLCPPSGLQSVEHRTDHRGGTEPATSDATRTLHNLWRVRQGLAPLEDDIAHVEDVS